MPKPTAGSILVKIKAASVNPGDWKLQSGILRPFVPPKFPFVPGESSLARTLVDDVDFMFCKVLA